MAKKKDAPAKDTEDDAEGTEDDKGSKGSKGSKKSLLPFVILAVGMVAAAFVFKSCGSSGGEEAKGEEAAAEASHGTTTTLPADTPRINLEFEPMTVNVSDGKYLRVGMAVSMMQGATYGEDHHDPEHPVATIPVVHAGGGGHGGGGTPAEMVAPIVEELSPEVNDMVIKTLGGADSNFLTTPQGREQARNQLSTLLGEHLHADVQLYFTSFVVA